MQRSTTLFTNARLVTMNARRDVLRADLLVENGRIAGIGPGLAAPADAEVIDCQGLTLIPGLIQTHIHLCQTLFRGLADDLLLLDWLKDRIWPFEGGHDPDSLETSAYLGIAELLRGGTTTIVDMETVHHTDRAIRAIERSGIRAHVGKVMMDAGGGVPESLMEGTHDSLSESIRLLEKWHGADEGRIRYAFAPRFAVSCTEELLRKVGEAARHFGVLVHTHASENQDEIALVMNERGKRNVAYFEHLGLAGPNLLLAHCIWLDEAEKEILARTGTKVLHCPSSNLKLGSGIAQVPDLLSRGIHVSIGADGAPCNNNLDGFQEMRMAALIQKPIHGPTSMPAPQVFALATLGGARAIGQEHELGSLEVGKRADVVAVALTGSHVVPSTEENVYSQLVYAARTTDVRMTMVDGRMVYRDSQLLTFDEAAVLAEVPQALDRVLKRVGAAGSLLSSGVR
ncbi:MAG TPA: 5'-deoxyadenosine deaminase [Pantanalinema sp.]